MKAKLKKGQEQRRDYLAQRYFGNNEVDFMVAEKGRNGIVRLGEGVIIKAEHGGAFRKPTFTVLQTRFVYGVSYDQSVGAEEITLYTPFGNQQWNVYDAEVFVVMVLERIGQPDAARVLDDAIQRTQA